MAKINTLYKAYQLLRTLENIMDKELASHQKNPETSELHDHEYMEFSHTQSCITNAEAAFFGGFACLNERKCEEDEEWFDFMEVPEMHITTPPLPKFEEDETHENSEEYTRWK